MPTNDWPPASVGLAVNIRRLQGADAEQVSALFALIAQDPTANQFHPHPFNREYAFKVSNYPGKDIYIGVFADAELVGYGMLRGWDEGYAIPSLGIYLAPSIRGKGVAKIVMRTLHRLASDAGAIRIRLKVYPDNLSALNLYKSLGYEFAAEDAEQWVGHLELGGSGSNVSR